MHKIDLSYFIADTLGYLHIRPGYKAMADKESNGSSTVDGEVAEIDIQADEEKPENGSSVDKDIYCTENEDKGKTESVEDQSARKKEELLDSAAAGGDRRDDPAEIKSKSNAGESNLVNSGSDGDMNWDSVDDAMKEEPMDTTSDDIKKSEASDQSELVSTMSDGVGKNELANVTLDDEGCVNIPSNKGKESIGPSVVASEGRALDTVAYADEKSELAAEKYKTANEDADKSEKIELVNAVSDDAEKSKGSELVNTAPESSSIDSKKSETSLPIDTAFDDTEKSEKSEPANTVPNKLEETESGSVLSDAVNKTGTDEPTCTNTASADAEQSMPVDIVPDKLEPSSITSDDIKKSDTSEKDEPVDVALDDADNNELVNTIPDKTESSSIASDAVQKSEKDESACDETETSDNEPVNMTPSRHEKTDSISIASDAVKKSETSGKDEPADTASDSAEKSEPVNTTPDKLQKTESGSDAIEKSETSGKDEPVNTASDVSEMSEESVPVSTAPGKLECGSVASDDVKKSETSAPLDMAPDSAEKSEKREPVNTALDKLEKSESSNDRSGKDEPADAVSESTKKEKQVSDRYQPLDERIVRDDIDFCGRDWDGEELKRGYIPTPRPKLLATPPTFTEVPPGATFFKEVSRQAILEIEYEDPFESIKLFSLIGVEKRPITLEDVPAEYRPYKGCIFVSECLLHTHAFTII